MGNTFQSSANVTADISDNIRHWNLIFEHHLETTYTLGTCTCTHIPYPTTGEYTPYGTSDWVISIDEDSDANGNIVDEDTDVDSKSVEEDTDADGNTIDEGREDDLNFSEEDEDCPE